MQRVAAGGLIVAVGLFVAGVFPARAAPSGIAKDLTSSVVPLFVSGSFRRGVSWQYHESSVEIVSRELNPVDQTWQAWKNVQAVDWQLEAVTARHANQLYVAGKSGQQRIISKWTLPSVPTGAYYSARPEGASIGTPTPLSVPIVGIVGGGAYVPVESRPTDVSYAPTRERLYLGEDFDRIWNMLVDPEGRFLMILTKDAGNPSKLFQLDLTQGGAPTLLADSFQQPLLTDAQQFSVSDKRGTPAAGRIYELWEAPVRLNSGLYLVDPENDGVFRIQVLTFKASYIAYPETDWIDSFIVL